MKKWCLKLSGVFIFVILLIAVIFSVRREGKETEVTTTEPSLVYNEYQTKKSAINYYKIEDGILYGRGRNTEGQLGLGKIDPLEVEYNYDVEIARNVIHVDASNNGTVVYITEDGELYGIGNNSSGQLGQSIEGKNRLSDEVNISTPVLIDTEVRYALVGINFTMYLTKDDKLYVLGDNANGQLGNGEAKPVMAGRYTSDTTPYSSEPVLVMENVRYIDCGLYNLAAITKGGDLYMWGDNSFGEIGNGRIGNKMPTASIDVVSEPYFVMKNVQKVTIDEFTVSAETLQGEIYTWGNGIVEPQKVEENSDDVTANDTGESEQNERNPEDILPADKVSVVEQTLTMDQVATDKEKNEIINLISNLSAEDYKNAIDYDKNSREIIEGDHLVVITTNESEDIIIYGYTGSKYGSRGIIVDNKGVKSYFDYVWSEQRECRKIYEADFDKDGIEEVAFIMAGGYGTGVSVERLIIFEPKDEGVQVIAYEFAGEALQQEFEKVYDFQVDVANWELRVLKNGEIERTLDWKNSSKNY